MKGLWRLGSILRVLVRHGFGNLVEQMLSREKAGPSESRERESFLSAGFHSPRRIRLVLEELGPSFIKLGQLMSTRADIFPPNYIEELRKLQDRVPPVDGREVRRVIESELKRPIEEVFAEFGSEPMAAASVAQVHSAVLFSGEKVAVKVVRPGIGKKIQEDIRLMYYFAGKIEKNLEVGRILGAVNLVKEFERTVFKELDMLIEAGNIEKFAHYFHDSQELYIPRVYWDYTTKKILVMEHIEGIKMDQVEEIRANGIDPNEIAMIGLRSFSRQLMEFGFFHADPHPGNTIVMYDGRVGLVDFGITGYLDEEMMHQIANLFLGYAEHDYDLVMDALLEAGLVDAQTTDLKNFRMDLKEISEPFYGRSLKTISVRDVYDQTMRLVYKYQVRLPRNLLLLMKTFVQTEALGKILGTDASLLEVTRPYARELLQRGYEAKKLFKNMGREALGLGGYLKGMPRFVHDILQQAARGKGRLEVNLSGLERLEGQVGKGINRLTIGLVISASVIAAAMVLNSSQRVFDFTIDFFGEKTISFTEALGIVGYIIATILGIWLIVLILRSGKL